MTAPDGEPPPLVDASRPLAPRIYDFLLGGKDNYAADRALGEELLRLSPGLDDLARVNRAFVLKAVQWSASMLGIGQFLDLGCGLPSRPYVHTAARQGCEDARVVYVDRDPMVICHAAALEAGPGLAAVKADVSDPGRVLEVVADLAVAGAGRLIDFRQPVCAIFGGTLSAMPADVARNAVRGYMAALARGSAVIISCASYADREHGVVMEKAFAPAADWRNHSLAEVESFFAAANLRVMRGRVADVASWPMLPAETPDVAVLGGIGVKGRP